MTTLAPLNDGQLIRQFNERLRDLENRTSLRLGDWVLKAQPSGLLTATLPGAAPVVLSQTIDYTKAIQTAVVSAITKGGYVSASDLAAALGVLEGTVNGTPDTILVQISQWASGLVTGWLNALKLTGVTTPDAFVKLLTGMFPAVQKAVDGTLHGLNVDGITNNLNGTWQYIASEAQGGVSQLVQQADGTIITMQQAVQHAVTGAALAGAPIAQAVASGQKAVDHGIAAIQGLPVQAAQSAEQYADAMTTMFTNWVNAWQGSILQSAASPEITAAAAAAAAQAAAQAALTASINAQLPHFYGGHGTSGLNAQVTFTGSLPGTFTPISTIAATSAQYNTPADTDEQTVSGIWSSVDAYAKYLFLRGSVLFDTVVYAKLQNNDPLSGAANCKIVAVVGGVQTVLTTFTLPVTGTMVANQNYSFEATDYTFTVTGPNGLNVSIIDSLHTSQIGALYRYGGFGTDGWARSGTSTFVAPNGAWVGNYTVPSWIINGSQFDVFVDVQQAEYGERTLTVGTDFALSSLGATVQLFSGTARFPGNDVGPSIPFGVSPPSSMVYHNVLYTFGADYGFVGITAVDPTIPGSLNTWAFYDSGPSSGPAAAFVATTETTPSSTYTNLATTTDQVTVTIGPSGLAIVFLAAQLSGTVLGGSTYMSFGLTGANTIAATDNNSIFSYADSGGPKNFGAPFLVTNLNAGATTFKAEYKAGGGNTATFALRNLAVIPL